MSDYFLLEVYTHELKLPSSSGEHAAEAVAALQASPGTGASIAPLALAFQFMDYPLLLTYGPPAGQGGARPGPQGSIAISFASGKSCVFQEDAEELQFVLEKVDDLGWLMLVA